MKLGMKICTDDAETVFHAFRFATHALKKKDEVRIFLMGKGVTADGQDSGEYKVSEQIRAFLAGGGKLFGCGSCLKQHNLTPSETRPASTIDDLYALVAECDKVLTY